ncbi:MAG: hypothetical protein ACRDIF_07815 [Actinomycetota bacterium]
MRREGHPDDSRLLELLGRALDPGPVAPSPGRVRALRAKAAAGRDLLAAAGPRRRLRLAMAALATVALVATFALGLTLGHSPPRWVRDLAVRTGLPVDSSELLEAQASVHRLAVALGRPQPSRAEVEKTLMDMVRRVTSVEQKEQGKIVPVAHQVHDRALQFLARNSQGEEPRH